MTAQDLKNSILQQAIQGKLLPQNPADEPASELLKKISAQRQKLIDEGKKKILRNFRQLPTTKSLLTFPTAGSGSDSAKLEKRTSD